MRSKIMTALKQNRKKTTEKNHFLKTWNFWVPCFLPQPLQGMSKVSSQWWRPSWVGIDG